MPDLWDIYSREEIQSSLPLEEFVGEVLAGKHGRFSTQEIVAFLRRMEASIHSNIEMMAENNPDAASLAEDSKRAASDDIARIIDLVESRAS